MHFILHSRCSNSYNSTYDTYNYDYKCYCLQSYFYYIPTTLTTVTITDATNIPLMAFNGSMIGIGTREKTAFLAEHLLTV